MVAVPPDLRLSDLPLAPRLAEVSSLLGAHRLLVLQAEPGAGKSTLVPPFLMDVPWLGGAGIVMLEPRRVAAAAVATRIAELLGEPVGKRAGFRVRSAARVSEETRIEVVTEALLTRRIQADPLLEGVGLVILDEFHERSIHADLALALALEVKRARPELALLLMSATLEMHRLADHLRAAAGSAPAVLSVPGRSHPVRTSYRPPPERGPWEPAFARLLAETAAEADGSVLAFLPGMREIRRVAAALGQAAEVLHGSMPLEAQRRVLAPTGALCKRIILATSVAETSLTVPDVRAVADSGWARTSRFHPAAGMDRLVTERVSASSAEQRRGRAGRLGPGLCVRFWRETDALPSTPEPEILRSDLAGVVLECAIWGVRTPDGLPWLDLPPQGPWAQAAGILRALGCIDGSGAATDRGRAAAALGLHPRLASLVRVGAGRHAATLAATLAALIEERDGSGLEGDPDLRSRLDLVRTGRGGSSAWREAVGRETARILRSLHVPRRDWSEGDQERAGDLLVHAFPDRVTRREPDGTWRFPSGRVARLIPGPGLAPLPAAAPGADDPESWLVATDVDAGETIGTIRLAAPVDRDAALRALAPVTTETTEIRWTGLTPKGTSVRAAGKLLLAARPSRPDPEVVAAAFFDRLRAEGLGILPWDEGTRRLADRLRFYAIGRGELALACDGPLDRCLAERGSAWLAGWLRSGGGPVLTSERLHQALAALPSGRGALDRLAPESVTLPTGGRRRIDYSGAEPAVEARIQEVFGLTRTPTVGSMPLTFRLLSPAGRPLQITRDLESFWKNTYPEVRREMRGRYPRHHWPEDPLAAQPTTRAKPRGPRPRS
jgi:ATP-dependent helicase HrpB